VRIIDGILKYFLLRFASFTRLTHEEGVLRMKMKKFLMIFMLIGVTGLAAGCHYKSSDSNRYGSGYGTYRDGYGNYREGYRDGRAAERRRDNWRDSRWDDRRDYRRGRW
jgi:hypothetical protein